MTTRDKLYQDLIYDQSVFQSQRKVGKILMLLSHPSEHEGVCEWVKENRADIKIITIRRRKHGRRPKRTQKPA